MKGKRSTWYPNDRLSCRLIETSMENLSQNIIMDLSPIFLVEATFLIPRSNLLGDRISRGFTAINSNS